MEDITDAKASRQLAFCWLAATLWIALSVSAAAVPAFAKTGIPSLAQLALAILLVAVHTALSYGWRGFAAYFAISVGAAFLLEASSIATGFPFGFYVHHMPGPKPLGVPIPVMLGYMWLGWAAWAIARLIARRNPALADRGAARFTTPLLASFILAGFDLSYDAIGSTVQGVWSYRDPSGYFGVPLSNFLGWLFTGWVIFQLFALVEARFPRGLRLLSSPSYWLVPCVFWAGGALQYPLLLAHARAGTTSVGGRSFLITDVYEAAVVVSLLTMVLAGLAGAIRAAALRPATSQTAPTI